MTKAKHERRPLTASQKEQLRLWREQLKLCKSMHYKASAHELRLKIRNLLAAQDVR